MTKAHLDEVLRPTAQQLAWQDMELGVFFHYGLNSFHGKEWSDGTLPAESFNPEDLDADQWVRTAAEMGAKYVVLTAKHHDGFCLWPTKTTDYSVASSPWRGGRGDVVKEVSDACAKYGLKLGLYLSPWDRHESSYEDPVAYSQLYCEQLQELCTGYGPVSELWFDGAGSEGYEYDWKAIMAVAKEFQPDAMIFNMGDPTIRWVGNENGLASDPVEYVVRSTEMSNYTVVTSEFTEALYLPPECDVSIRRGWFWSRDDEPKTVEHLLAIYYNSVGMGANLLLNIPPDTRGLIDARDLDSVESFSGELRRRFGNPSAVSLVQVRPGVWEGYVDGRFDHIRLKEDLQNGQRIVGHKVKLDGVQIADGMTVGHSRLHMHPEVGPGMLTIEIDGEGTELRAADVFQTGVTRAPMVPEGYVAPTDAPED